MRRARPAAAPKRAAAKGGARHPLHRPAAAAPRRRGAEAPERSIEEKYAAGEEIKASDLPAGGFARGDWLLVVAGTYYQQEVQAAGKVLKEEIDSGERELKVELTGTTSEELLRFATSSRPSLVRWHLCGPGCHRQRENPDLLHAKKVRKLPMDFVATWEVNLIEEAETQALRQEQEQWRKEKEAEKNKEAESSSSTGKKKKGKKKKKKKDKKEKRKKEGEESAPAAKKQKIGGKTRAKKPLEDIFGGTGLDPSSRIRKKLAKRTKKALKKSAASSSSTSGSTSSSSSEMDEGETEILSDRSRVHRIASLAPGLLSATSIDTMRGYLVQVSGKESRSRYHPSFLCTT